MPASSSSHRQRVLLNHDIGHEARLANEQWPTLVVSSSHETSAGATVEFLICRPLLAQGIVLFPPKFAMLQSQGLGPRQYIVDGEA